MGRWRSSALSDLERQALWVRRHVTRKIRVQVVLSMGSRALPRSAPGPVMKWDRRRKGHRYWSKPATRNTLLGMALSILLALATISPQGSVTVDAGRGPLTVTLPAGYDPAEPIPLILLLHGFGASGAIQESYMRFRPIQDQYGYAFCAPDGTVNGGGQRFWNATDACCDFQTSGVDDSAYLRSLIETIEATVAIDARSIHLVGHSNGGFMSYRMACEHADKIASIASLAGAMFQDPADCVGTGPVHVLQIHGTADGTIGYGGGAILGNSYPSALESTQAWAQRNGCGLTIDTEDQALNLDSSLSGRETSRTRFIGDCAIGGSVELWTIEGGSHTPNLSPFFARRVVEHLLARPKADPAGEVYCSPAPLNSSGASGSISAFGSDVLVDNALTLRASGLPVQTFGYFLNSLTEGSTVPPGSEGVLCLGGQVGRFSADVLNSGPAGEFTLDLDLLDLPNNPPATAVIGEVWKFQAWFRDANPQVTSNLTDAIRVTIR